MNIAIIEPNYILRDSLRLLLNQVADFDVIYDAEVIQDLFNYSDSISINVVLLDAGTAVENLADVICKTRGFSETIKIIVLTDAADLYYWKNCLENVVEGIMLKNSRKLDFENGIRSLVNGERIGNPLQKNKH